MKFFFVTLKSNDNFWEATYLPQSIRKDIWHYVYQNKTINRETHAKGILKIYVFNWGDKPVYVDDFRIVLKGGG